jgi:hypothetical protein
MGAKVVVQYPFMLFILTCPFEVTGSYQISIVDYLIPWIIRILPAVILDIIPQQRAAHCFSSCLLVEIGFNYLIGRILDARVLDRWCWFHVCRRGRVVEIKIKSFGGGELVFFFGRSCMSSSNIMIVVSLS